MSPEQSDNGETPQGGVLAALPRTRPQRASARRAAARAQTKSETAAAKPARASTAGARDAKKAKPEPKKAKPAKKQPPRPAAATKPAVKRKPAAKRTPARVTARGQVQEGQVQERAPKQGYEPEEEIELGATVHPPSGTELIESIADIFGELANAGATAGGRLLKDALSVFRRP